MHGDIKINFFKLSSRILVMRCCGECCLVREHSSFGLCRSDLGPGFIPLSSLELFSILLITLVEGIVTVRPLNLFRNQNQEADLSSGTPENATAEVEKGCYRQPQESCIFDRHCEFAHHA
ncbi:hypothetical protein AAHA92_28483 [Salvia divinorum]|uniref:C3H1-type domain-containing protein n=1 Tax=Salvia divinorum TaxID=28513 RepID=A0ABD1FV72_SALDI